MPTAANNSGSVAAKRTVASLDSAVMPTMTTASTSGGAGPLDDLRAIGVEIVLIEMRVGVDERHGDEA